MSDQHFGDITNSELTVSLTTDWTVYEGYTCEGVNGFDSDLLRDWEGTAEECKVKCVELGNDCVGFVRVNNGSSTFDGKCYFRSTTLTDPEEATGDDRDCYVRNTFGMFHIDTCSLVFSITVFENVEY